MKGMCHDTFSLPNANAYSFWVGLFKRCDYCRVDLSSHPVHSTTFTVIPIPVRGHNSLFVLKVPLNTKKPTNQPCQLDCLILRHSSVVLFYNKLNFFYDKESSGITCQLWVCCIIDLDAVSHCLLSQNSQVQKMVHSIDIFAVVIFT